LPGPSPRPSLARLHIGDLVGLPTKGGDNKPPDIGVVTGLQAGKAEVRTLHHTKTLQVPARQLELLATCPDPGTTPPRDPGQAPWHLTADVLAVATPPRRDLAAAWLLLGADLPPGGEADELTLDAFSELVCGQCDPPHACACWLWLQGSQTFFRLKQGLIQPRPLAELRRIRQDRHRQRRLADQERDWISALKRRQPLVADELPAKQARDLDQLRLWASGDRHLTLSEDLHSLLQQVRCSTEPADVRHLLADVGLWPRHHLPALQGTSWQQGFSNALQAEAERLLALADGVLPGDDQRLDLSHLHTITIDDEDTLDIDDGLSLEWVAEGDPRLWIHVADPGRLIAPGSPLDLEARRRGTSLYLAQGTLPMFPEMLANGPMSLRSGRRCAAWSLRIQLAPDGALLEMDLHRSWVRPAYRLSYADADELLELAPPQEQSLLTLHALLRQRRAWRAARGALFLDQPEGRVRRAGPNPEDDTAQLDIIEPTASRLLVAEAMVLAGAAVADYGRRHQIPLPYRGQPATPIPSAAELEALPAGPARLTAVKRCLTRGVVGTAPQPHFSLGLEAYVQATSPIRRYGDLLVQRQLADHLEGRPPIEASALSDLLTTVDAGVREGIAISRADQRHWQQVWFAAQREPQWRGVFLRWLRDDHHLALVHIESLAMDLAAECPGTPQPGDAVLVRVRDVDPLRDLLRLEARAS
jgi:exoribonuclease-2